jgi:hypothetical protein
LLLAEIIAYRQGKGKYNFSRLSDEKRSIAALGAWESLEMRIDQYLASPAVVPFSAMEIEACLGGEAVTALMARRAAIDAEIASRR